MEENLSRSIVYNLNILKQAVPCSKQTEEVLVEGVFVKSSTNAFVYITQYLFTIIDSKEFKKRFYWPIVDKRSENAYRTSSVDFINMLIEKYNLQYEHVKQVNVVHPSGKKFMGLILEIIQIAIKEVMQRKYKCTDYERSININKSLSVAKDVSQVEIDVQQMLNDDVKVIKERSSKIQDILTQIIDQEEVTNYERFVSKWYNYLLENSKAIEQQNVSINDIVKKSHELFTKAQEMMSKKDFSLSVTPNEAYDTSISSLTENMKNILPIIKNFIESYPVSEAAVTEEEKQIVLSRLKELEQMDVIVKRLSEKCKTLHTTCSKLQATNEDLQLLDNDISMSGDNDNWKMSAFSEMSLSFDASKNCVASVDLKDSHQIALLDENENIRGSTSVINRTLDMNVAAERTFKAPTNQLAPPSRRRRRDPMALLNKATTSTANTRNQSFMGDNSMLSIRGPTSTPLPLSSTMLSPDMYGGNKMMLNFSTVSSISVMSQPRHHIESPIDATIEEKTVINEKAAMDDITNTLPKITLTNATLMSSEYETQIEKENFGSDMSTLMARKSMNDEDLFNISDSCLVRADD